MSTDNCMDHPRFAHPRWPAPTPPDPSSAYGQGFGGNRPLSDIKEITEPSLLESVRRRPYARGENTGGPPQRTYSKTRNRTPDALQPRTNVYPVSQAPRTHTRPESRKANPALSPLRRLGSRQNHHQAQDSPGSYASSPHSIPIDRIPPRSSSRQQHRPSHSLSREPAVPIPAQPSAKHSISNRGQSRSPIKEAISRLVPETKVRRVPSRTLIRANDPVTSDILDRPIHNHHRLKVDLQVAAPLFVGGSSAEGIVRIVVDEAERVRHRKLLTLDRMRVDLVGVEEVSGPRRHIFLALGNELIDDTHPPPKDMVQQYQPSVTQGHSWILAPSMSVFPFLISLPLEVGPPPFQSKHARIKYVLSVTLTIKDAGRPLVVRCSQETAVLSVYDPEKALISLPSPLTASDEFSAHHGLDRVVATAGLHRQVWVSGTSIFADVHIVNESRKKIKKLELQLERIIFCYRHAAAATMEMSASQARLFDSSERVVVCKSTVRHGNQGWKGVEPHTHDLRTCHLEVPRGHATIKCYKYFEVRYYLNIIVGTAHTKLAMVQLPIILIHMNSLDVPTNSVAQVAAAIEEKRANASSSNNNARSSHPHATQHNRTSSRQSKQATSAAGTTAQGSPRLSRNPSRLQGRAFAAPRMASLERQRAHAEDLTHLRSTLDASPRKHIPSTRPPPATAREEAPLPSLPPPPKIGRRLEYTPPIGLRYDGATSGAENSTGSGSGRGPSFGFKTPPSKRRGRLMNEHEMGGLLERLGQRPSISDMIRSNSNGKGKGKEKTKAHTRSKCGSSTTGDIMLTDLRKVEKANDPNTKQTLPKRAASSMDDYGRRKEEDPTTRGLAQDGGALARLDAGFRAKLTSQRSFGQFGLKAKGLANKPWGRPGWL